MRPFLKAFFFLALAAVAHPQRQDQQPTPAPNPPTPAQPPAVAPKPPAPVLSPAPGVPDVTPGASTRILGENFPTQAPLPKVEVVIRSEKPGEQARPPVAATVVDPKTLSFTVPKDLTPGRYLLDVLIAGEKRPVSGEMRVLANAVTVLSHPAAAAERPVRPGNQWEQLLSQPRGQRGGSRRAGPRSRSSLRGYQ